MKKLTLTAVGLKYRITPSTQRDLATKVPLVAELKREPSNQHDENAIKVYVVEPSRWHIGYISRQLAAELAPKLDSGEIFIVSATVEGIDLNNGTAELEVSVKRRQKRKSR